MYPLSKKKEENIITVLKTGKNMMTFELQIITQPLYRKTPIPYQIPWSNTHIVDYGVLAIHESNGPFPVARQ